jgi:hypothetical protein
MVQWRQVLDVGSAESRTPSARATQLAGPSAKSSIGDLSSDKREELIWRGSANQRLKKLGGNRSTQVLPAALCREGLPPIGSHRNRAILKRRSPS